VLTKPEGGRKDFYLPPSSYFVVRIVTLSLHSLSEIAKKVGQKPAFIRELDA
jgi:hypothetical protein